MSQIVNIFKFNLFFIIFATFFISCLLIRLVTIFFFFLIKVTSYLWGINAKQSNMYSSLLWNKGAGGKSALGFPTLQHYAEPVFTIAMAVSTHFVS